jgi:CubicO group peptidase (beta-lactamase class C family)
MNRKRQFTRLLALLFVLLALLGVPGTQSTLSIVAAQTSTPDVYWPTAGWRISTPEAQGMNSHSLEQMLDAVKQQKLNLYSLLVIRHGYIVSETYFTSYKQDTKHEVYSCTKSIIATLIGIALDQQRIDSLDHPVVSYFPERTFENLDAAKKAMTLENLLTMTSGLDWQEGDPEYIGMYRSRDWVNYVMDKPMKAEPGSQFNYCSGCSHVLSAIVQKATGTKTSDFAARYLFEPLGISNVSWETDSSGIDLGGWGVQITPRDMAKLGYLYLRHGIWDGKQLVRAQWVETATRSHTATDSNLDYGYQWWIVPSLEGYAALGRFGQTILVIPKLDLIVVTTAQVENHDAIFELIGQYVVPAVLTP